MKKGSNSDEDQCAICLKRDFFTKGGKKMHSKCSHILYPRFRTILS